jgi:hypothetical protein
LSRRVIDNPSLPVPMRGGAFSSGVEAPAGRTIYVSGQVSIEDRSQILWTICPLFVWWLYIDLRVICKQAPSSFDDYHVDDVLAISSHFVRAGGERTA